MTAIKPVKSRICKHNKMQTKAFVQFPKPCVVGSSPTVPARKIKASRDFLWKLLILVGQLVGQ